MKVGIVHFFPPGIWQQTGDMTQIFETEAALVAMGVDIHRFDIWARKPQFDILHLFGNSFELANLAIFAKQMGIKIVFSPIAYSARPSWQLALWKYVDPLLPLATSHRQFKRLLQTADAILPGSNEEAVQLQLKYGVGSGKMQTVYAGIYDHLASASPERFVQQYGMQDFVLQVGRICDRKGQLRVIKALDSDRLPLVFVGYANPAEPDYVAEFRRAVAERPWVRYLEVLPADMLASAYAAAKVHVLPSSGECPGFTNLEAGMAGVNVVASDERPVKEYLGDEAFYCEPSSVGSIRTAILKAYAADKDKSLQRRLLETFTWRKVAKQLLEIYQHVLATE